MHFSTVLKHMPRSSVVWRCVAWYLSYQQCGESCWLHLQGTDGGCSFLPKCSSYLLPTWRLKRQNLSIHLQSLFFRQCDTQIHTTGKRFLYFKLYLFRYRRWEYNVEIAFNKRLGTSAAFRGSLQWHGRTFMTRDCRSLPLNMPPPPPSTNPRAAWITASKCHEFVPRTDTTVYKIRCNGNRDLGVCVRFLLYFTPLFF